MLRLRNYTLGKRLTDGEITGDDALQRIISIFKKMEPFVSPSFPHSESSFFFSFFSYSAGDLCISTIIYINYMYLLLFILFRQAVK